ncbi:hypothetical protein [Rhizobacter sp. P5_C2]
MNSKPLPTFGTISKVRKSVAPPAKRHRSHPPPQQIDPFRRLELRAFVVAHIGHELRPASVRTVASPKPRCSASSISAAHSLASNKPGTESTRGE